MKLLTYTLATTALIANSIFAQDKNVIEAKLISTTISAPLPKGTPSSERPYNYSPGATGKTGYVTIYNKAFTGIVEELEAEGYVNVLIGLESKSKEVTLKAEAKPIEFDDFTMELVIDDQNAEFKRSGITITGSHNTIKSLTVTRGDKTIRTNGSYTSGDSKTFRYREIKDGDKVKVEYWSKLTTKAVKIYK